ncbi:PUB3 [Symbiodinium pilosum]|uniref:Vacuolar protein 8 n=1 Tax=Symbiodinium pilosum TaxID=2952 RepID=A0A812X065_SYMPI|nr:PUB3 [Symbiodinium pilosum]
MAKLLDAEGQEAVVGKSQGFWLDSDDFVSTADLDPEHFGKVGFPRDWPGVYGSSKALKQLVGKKGKCAGKKVGVVPGPDASQLSMVKGLQFYPLQSFSNAERAAKAAGMDVVRGWAVYEHLDKGVSEAFVAERFWWNSLPDGTWIDFTPRPDTLPEMLLAEAVDGAPKAMDALSSRQQSIMLSLLAQRFPGRAVPASEKSEPKETKPAASATSSTTTSSTKVTTKIQQSTKASPKPTGPAPASLRELARRIQSGDVEAVRQMEEKLRGDDELCVQIASEGLATPLSKMLGDSKSQEAALKLMLMLTDAGVTQPGSDIGTEMIAGGAVPSLRELLSSSNEAFQEMSAAVLGNLCHESPENQDKLAEAGIFGKLVELLSSGATAAQEAAYAIWNLTVGHEKNSDAIARLGAVPKLADLLKNTSDIAQENAAGALMHITMSAEARAAISKCNAIPKLCELLQPSYEPEVSTQAAGALLNLASDCSDYAKEIVANNAIGPLINLVKDGPDLAREYAAGALMNLMRGEMEVASDAAKLSAIPALASLLSRSSGHSEALGALANLASGSADRQIQIYKAQVTRKTVSLLGDPDIDVRRSAAALLMNLAPHGKIKERIVEAGALKPLTKSLKDEDEILKERAAGALANLFNDHSANVHTGFQQASEMIPSLVALIQEAGLSEDAKRQAAHALAMLAAEDGPCDAVWQAKAGPPLIALLKEMIGEAALGIMNLSWRWPEVKAELAKGGTLEYLMDMLRLGDPMAKEYAAGALMNMTAGSPDSAEKVTPAVKDLAELLKADAIQAAEWAAGALANIVRSGPSAQETAVAQGATTSLANLLPRVTPNGMTLVVLALTSLAETQASAVTKALGPKEKAKLRDFRDSSNPDLQDYTKALVDKLGPGFSI